MKNGFTLIDVLVGTFLMLIVFLGIFGAYQLGLKVVGQSKARITAIALANQKMEMARNLPYNEVGTIGGIPPGALAPIETITRNNIDYTVKTTVVYIDDPFDGLTPDDPLAKDYKRIKVEISWPGRIGGKIELITDVAPKGVESEIGGGTLVISVFDSLGAGVPQADIHIVNNQVTPPIDVWYQTDSDGDLRIPGAPPSVESYQITVSKLGYSTERTYGREEVSNPSRPHATVFEGQITEISFSIDKVSTFLIQTTGSRDQDYPPITNLNFNLKGEKIIGTDSGGNPVYKYSQDHNSGNDAEIEIANLEWDSYTFSVDWAATGLNLTEIESPFGSATSQPIYLLPNTIKEVRLILEAENSLLITVKDALTTQPIFAASVRVYNHSLGYDQLQPTDEQGQAFFIPLEAATYDLEITALDYQDYSGSISVSGATTETINLTPI